MNGERKLLHIYNGVCEPERRNQRFAEKSMELRAILLKTTETNSTHFLLPAAAGIERKKATKER